MTVYTEGFHVKGQEGHDQTECGTGQEATDPGDKQITFPVNGIWGDFRFRGRSHKIPKKEVRFALE
ncbi:hypothetical protein SRABI106_04345 [Rahnella aquatilis]|nr:hypothetical protein SRABI106_04345 [Rahnella aquatilis]